MTRASGGSACSLSTNLHFPVHTPQCWTSEAGRSDATLPPHLRTGGTRTMIQYEAEELGQALFQESQDALFLFDPDSDQLLNVNPMAQRLSGFPRAELLQMQTGYLFRFEAQGGKNRIRQAANQS